MSAFPTITAVQKDTGASLKGELVASTSHSLLVKPATGGHTVALPHEEWTAVQTGTPDLDGLFDSFLGGTR